ncbi:protein RGF1 INDUCIBLE TRANSCRIPTION FACTOR 1-like [Nicotiana tomentosiformis]|uniref:protein RGF1 INDUCIBLE TRANSCRIPTION FACTOR 1-like n=1 Tax=Nicotiana tomentosiformis TaxID=4098 RepID=UPI00388C4559
MAISMSFIYARQTKNLTFLFLDYTKNNNKEKMVGNGSISIPKWLEVLLGEKFFNACLVHELQRKNEENVFCLDCCFSLCLHCLPSHKCHRLLQCSKANLVLFMWVCSCYFFPAQILQADLASNCNVDIVVVHFLILQIRRYVYQNVLRLKEADKLLDCSFVQSYTTNSAKVVFLNQRPITRQFKSSLNYTCIVCDRSIQRPNIFCSISCKVCIFWIN